MMRWLGVLTVVAVGCAGQARPTCFTSAPPSVGPAPHDELFALLRRELARVDDPRRAPALRAASVAALPSLRPSVHHTRQAYVCVAELGEHLLPGLARRPLPRSQLTLATLHQVAVSVVTIDYFDHVDQGLATHAVAALRALTELVDAETVPDRATAVSLNPEQLRFQARMALLHVQRYETNLLARFTDERLAQATDDREQLLLVEAGAQQLAMPARAHAASSVRLLRGWIEDAARRLDHRGDRIGFELVRAHLAQIGRRASDVGLAPPARALLQRIVDVKGHLLLATAADHGTVDLAMAARAALYDLDAPDDSHYGEAELVVESSPFDPWAAWNRAPPTLSEPERVLRMRELTDELGRLRYGIPRCHILEQLVRWTPPQEAEQRYADLLSAVHRRGQLVSSHETMCRLELALAYEAIPELRRAELAMWVLRAPASAFVAQDDGGHDSFDWMVMQDGFPSHLQHVAQTALVQHPGWLASAPALRAWLADGLAEGSDLWDFSEFDPIATALLRWDAEHDRAQGVRVLRAWLEAVRAAPDGWPPPHRIAALGRFAASFGLAGEAEVVLAAVLARHRVQPDAVRREVTLALYRLGL